MYLPPLGQIRLISIWELGVPQVLEAAVWAGYADFSRVHFFFKFKDFLNSVIFYVLFS